MHNFHYDFNECIRFLNEYSFLWNHRNIDYFVDDVWKNVPEEWIEHLSNTNFAQHGELAAKELPDSLQQFVQNAESLSILGDAPSTSEMNVGETPKQIKAKKAHELCNLAELLRQKCKELNVSRVVDIGCGLGHLLAALQFDDHPMELIGVECDTSLCAAGAQKYESIKYDNVRLCMGTDNEECKRILSPDGHRTAIVSLHGCGDLQPLIIRKFSQLSRDRNPLLVTVACCFHKMTVADKPVAEWCLSESARSSFKNLDVNFTLPPPALRLACQQRMSSLRNMTKEEHTEHERQFFYRAALEYFLQNSGLDQRKLPRGATRLPLKLDCLEHFRTFIEKCGIYGEQVEDSVAQFEELLKKFQPYKETIEPFTTLQFYMQSVLESFILADRAAFLKEFENLRVNLIPVFESSISPRNMALFAHTQHVT